MTLMASGQRPASATIADGSVTTAKLATNALTADVAGRLKMQDGYVTVAKVATGTFTADAAGRAPFAAGFADASLLASDAVTTVKILNANVTTAKLAADSVTGAKIRLDNNETLRGRNAANTADIPIAKIAADNRVYIAPDAATEVLIGNKVTINNLTAAPQATLHVLTGDAGGGIAPHADRDDLFVEVGADGGLTVMTPTNGRPSFQLTTAGMGNTGGLVITTDGAQTNEHEIYCAGTLTHYLKNSGFYLIDGISAPGAIIGFAGLWVDSADGDLKITFGDGTTKTIVTDT